MVPPQDNNECQEYQFMIQLNEEITLVLPYTKNTTFMWSALLLPHRQSSNRRSQEKNFYNLTVYGNQKLYDHIRNTLQRIN